MNLETLIVPLLLDSSKYIEKLNEAKDSTNKFSDIGDKATALGGKFTKGVTLPIIGGLTGLVVAGSDWAETLDGLGDVLGTSADESATLAVAIKGVGGDVDAVTTQFAFLTKGLDDGKGGLGKTGQLMTDLGISFQDANGNLLPTIDIYKNIADKLAVMPDGLEKTKLMTELFGKSGKDLSDTLNSLAGEGLTNAHQKAQDLGLLMGEDGTNNAITMNRAINDLKLGGQGLAVSLSTTLIPMVTQLVGWITEGLKWFNNLNPGIKQTILIVLGLVAGIGPLLSIFGTLSTVIGAVIPIVTAIAGVISFPLIAIIAAIAGVIALVALAWKNDWGGIREKVEDVINFLRPFIENAMDGIKKVFELFQLAFSGDWEGFGKKLREIWDTAISNIRKAWDNFIHVDWGEVGRNIVQGIANGITSAIEWAKQAIINLGGAVLAAIRGFLGISSPSKMFKVKVGYEMATGQLEGYEEGIAKFKPNLNVAGSSALSSFAPSFVNFTYAPTMSLADAYEAENTLRPIIEQVVRQI